MHSARQFVRSGLGSLELLSYKHPHINPSIFQNKRHYLTNEECKEPFYPIAGRYPKTVLTKEEAFEDLASDQKIFIHGGAATPTLLTEGLCNVAKSKGLKGLQAFHIHMQGDVAFLKDNFDSGIIRSNSLFTGENCRKAINEGKADFTPIFLSEIPLLFRRNLIKLDHALISVSPPDQHGFCSLGVSVDITRSAIQNAKKITALVNNQMPRTRGNASIHVSQIDCIYQTDTPLPQLPIQPPSDAERAIGKIIASELVENGATLQTGIGSIPNAVLFELMGHSNLGVHTEMFSDGVVDLVNGGAITNANKKLRPGVIVSSFVIGSRKTFDFIHDNPFVDMCDIAWVNSTHIIQQNPKVTAINSAIEVDLTGQVVADSIGTRIYSGVGGQVDFMRGAALSEGGKPIIAMPSTTKRGESKIVPTLRPGAGVVTTRAHMHYLVTEYGVAYLFGRNTRQRAHSIIKIAHPDHREKLEKAAFEILKCMPSPD